MFFIISHYQNIYCLTDQIKSSQFFGRFRKHRKFDTKITKEMKILDFSIFVKKIFPNNVVLWCSMIITLFLAGLPPPPCYKMLCFSWPPPPPRGHNVICEWPLVHFGQIILLTHRKNVETIIGIKSPTFTCESIRHYLTKFF